ncbi:thiamine diphosphate-binding protein [Dunaliella salina]|uniref:pyruvate decarboxylase n=1 Tax=Dunaliella salina TaxID=3046 RepID=A0ABQ7GEP0_DUNSA|nr:thiamine diphosphate-binding protein [Dunaliella salina]|eukprot:KAF5833068.1 thiamine diphosphate-binding protein [Dunaliella salina]
MADTAMLFGDKPDSVCTGHPGMGIKPKKLTHEERVKLSAEAPNLGVHLANRLVELGCTTAFGVPGDFNLLLLDQLIKHPELDMVWCCNELNAGYAADGQITCCWGKHRYARRKGIGCCVVTFSVGGFSVLNAIAGAMSEDLPVIVISGVPNSNDYAQNRVLHHTTGMTNPASGGFNQQLRSFKEVTCYQATLNHVEDAHRLIDEAISSALVRKKPAYIEVCCNLADATHPSFTRPPVPFVLPHAHTNPHSCQAAVDAVGEVLDKAVKPVLLAGPRLRHGCERDAFLELAQSSKYAVAIQPDAKGMVPEDLEGFIGLYWGAVSWPCVCEIVESADLVVCCGTVWTDYSTVGYSLLLRPDHTINVSVFAQVAKARLAGVNGGVCTILYYSTVGYILLLWPGYTISMSLAA